jgi:hypothetical protein
VPTPDNRGPRRPRKDGDAPRSARPSRPTSATGGPRRDDSRPSRPRRDDERPLRPRSEGDRAARPRKFEDRPSRPSAGGAGRPRKFDDRPARPRREDGAAPRPRSADDRPSRPRGDSDRPSRPRSADDRPSRPRSFDDRSSSRGRPAFGRPTEGRGRPSEGRGRPSEGRGRPAFGRPTEGRGRPFRDDDRPIIPQTAAQRKADEVRRRTGGRKYDRDDMPRMEHTTSEWKDEGSVRPARRSKPRVEEQYDAPERDEKRASAAALAHIEATVGKKINSVVGDVAAKRLTAKLALALDAFERERWQDAKRIIIPVSRDCPGIKLIHEIAGLSLYRLGQWRDAADHLEQARAVSGGEVLNHPVLADCYRALMRYDKVDELWRELKEASPDPEIIAEGRIVAAGALADKGDVQAAVRLMQLAKQDPAKVREHHLREWYVLADLYDRSGDLINARSIFQRIASNDSNFSDVRDRLATLGVA